MRPPSVMASMDKRGAGKKERKDTDWKTVEPML